MTHFLFTCILEIPSRCALKAFGYYFNNHLVKEQTFKAYYYLRFQLECSKLSMGCPCDCISLRTYHVFAPIHGHFPQLYH